MDGQLNIRIAINSSRFFALLAIAAGVVLTLGVAGDLIPPVMNSREWLPFGVVFIAVVAVVLTPFLLRLPYDTLKYMLISAAVFLSGAIGLEFLGAVMLETEVVSSKSDWLYLLRRIFEEGLEMAGAVIFNWALYREILRQTAADCDMKYGFVIKKKGLARKMASPFFVWRPQGGSNPRCRRERAES